jgi:hypothetical protein
MNLLQVFKVFVPIRRDNKDRSVSDPKKELVHCGSHYDVLTCAGV